MRRNQSLYYHYHQVHERTTEDCRNLWDHLDRLVQFEIPHLLRDHLCLCLSLQLVLIYSPVFVNPIDKLMYIGNMFTRKKFPQTMLDWEASLESTNGHIVIVSVCFVKHLPISIRVGLQSFSLLHRHR